MNIIIRFKIWWLYLINIIIRFKILDLYLVSVLILTFTSQPNHNEQNYTEVLHVSHRFHRLIVRCTYVEADVIWTRPRQKEHNQRKIRIMKSHPTDPQWIIIETIKVKRHASRDRAECVACSEPPYAASGMGILVLSSSIVVWCFPWALLATHW